MRHRRALRWLSATAALLLLIFLGLFAAAVLYAQRADYGWRPSFATPAFVAGKGPAVTFDHAHHNASTTHWWGRYWPVARMLRADGYRVRRSSSAFTAGMLAETDVLVIANASGAAKPQFMGINLPFGEEGDRSAPAFQPREIAVVKTWVAAGGRLLLIADHAPFGTASAALAEAFGVRMHAGFTEVPGEVSDPLRFTRDNNRLGITHPIVSGADGGEPVACVQTFTGQSLDGPAGATILLRLPQGAIETVDVDGVQREKSAGAAQALAFEHGNGRVVVLGEAAMITAQVSEGIPFGMQLGDCENLAFARNTMRWLSTR